MVIITSDRHKVCITGCPALSCSVQDFFKLLWKPVIMLCCNIEVEDNQVAYFFLFTFPSLHLYPYEPIFCTWTLSLLPVGQITSIGCSDQDILYYQIIIFNMSLPS